MRLRLLVLACFLSVAIGAVSAQAPSIKTDASAMARKLATIVALGERPLSSKPRPPVRTSFSDREVNAYFQIHGSTFMPDGVIDPQVAIDEAGRVRVRAIVDLDQALKPKERSWLDPLAWVGGKVEVTAAGRLQASNGRGTLAIDTTTLGGVTVPKTLLQELVAYYTRTPEQPRGFNLEEPFELPSKIRSVETRRGQATVVQ